MASFAKRTLLVVFAALILLALRRQALLLDQSLAQEWSDGDGAKIMSTPEPSVAESREVAKPGSVKRKWAYAFVVGGCSSERPEYKGFIYNIAVAAQILQDSESKADIVAMIQMSVRTNETSLPEEESRMLEEMGVQVEYLPKFSSITHESFYTLMLEKFRILQMTQYSRVIFMDGDVMPLCSLDYLFELSEPESGEAVLKENIVLSYTNQPAHGGFFMLQPSQEDFERVQSIIKETEVKALQLPKPDHWDPIEGWGHKIVPPDRWKSSMRKWTSTNWTWHGVHADQGLLYHWTKYAKQSVTIIINHEVENWSSRDGTAVLESSFVNTLKEDPINELSCNPRRGNAPYHDFKHFTGKDKPWQRNHTHFRVPEDVRQNRRNRDESTNHFNKLVSSLNEAVREKGGKSLDETKLLSAFRDMVPAEGTKGGSTPVQAEKGDMLTELDSAYVKWFAALDKVEKKVGVKISFRRYLGRHTIRKPPVGAYPKLSDRMRHIKLKIEEGWDPYAS